MLPSLMETRQDSRLGRLVYLFAYPNGSSATYNNRAFDRPLTAEAFCLGA